MARKPFKPIRTIPLKSGENLKFIGVDGAYSILLSNGKIFSWNHYDLGFDLAHHYPGLTWDNYYFRVCSSRGAETFDLGILNQLKSRELFSVAVVLTPSHPLCKQLGGNLKEIETHLKALNLGFISYFGDDPDVKLVFLASQETLGEALPLSFLEDAFALAIKELSLKVGKPLTCDLSALNTDWNLALLLLILTQDDGDTNPNFSSIDYYHGTKEPTSLHLDPIQDGLSAMPWWAWIYLRDLILGYPIPMALSDAYATLLN